MTQFVCFFPFAFSVLLSFHFGMSFANVNLIARMEIKLTFRNIDKRMATIVSILFKHFRIISMILFNFRFIVRLKHFQAVDDNDTFTRACVNKLTSKWYLELNMFGLNANEITWKHVRFAHLFVHMFSLCPISLSRRVFFFFSFRLDGTRSLGKLDKFPFLGISFSM